MRILLTATLAACSGGAGTTASDTDDVVLWSTQDDTTPITTNEPVTSIPDGLNGTEPPVNLPPPTFASVLNRDGTPRAREDLLGHPTVMWFYPAASTGG